MYKIDFKQFKTLCERGNLVPVYKECLADMETPVSVLNRFENDEHVFLLESVEGGENWGRYSFIGIEPYAIFEVKDGVAQLKRGDQVQKLKVDPRGNFCSLKSVLDERKVVEVDGLPPLFAGAVGYAAYETVNEFEKLPEPKKDTGSPTSCFMLTDKFIIFDNVRHTLKIACCVNIDEFAGDHQTAYQSACTQIDRIEKILQAPVKHVLEAECGNGEEVKMTSNMTREEFCAMVKQAKQYIYDGEVIQVVLSQRFTTELKTSPLNLYRALRLINPSPYTFFLKFGTSKMLVGSSPEVMVRLSSSTAQVRPIAGTRKRGKDEQSDRALADELLADEKERAEHLMLVDLARNDLGRVANPGSVQVSDFMTVERYSHVMHLVSNARAEVKKDCDAFDLFKATFPAGTLSGAPKIRAMEIINELENSPRGAYGGAVGYFSFDGNMDTAITIRTLEIEGNKVSVQAGAGIVYDSDPEMEYQETLNKAAGMVKAITLANNGLKIED